MSFQQSAFRNAIAKIFAVPRCRPSKLRRALTESLLGSANFGLAVETLLPYQTSASAGRRLVKELFARRPGDEYLAS